MVCWASMTGSDEIFFVQGMIGMVVGVLVT